MPSIELDGHSEATFALVNGKIVRVEAPQPGGLVPNFEARLPGGREFPERD